MARRNLRQKMPPEESPINFLTNHLNRKKASSRKISPTSKKRDIKNCKYKPRALFICFFFCFFFWGVVPNQSHKANFYKTYRHSNYSLFIIMEINNTFKEKYHMEVELISKLAFASYLWSTAVLFNKSKRQFCMEIKLNFLGILTKKVVVSP